MGNGETIDSGLDQVVAETATVKSRFTCAETLVHIQHRFDLFLRCFRHMTVNGKHPLSWRVIDTARGAVVHEYQRAALDSCWALFSITRIEVLTRACDRRKASPSSKPS